MLLCKFTFYAGGSHYVSALSEKTDLLSIGLPQWLSNEEFAYNVVNTGDAGLIPGSRKSPGGGHGNLPQYSCLENPIDRGSWGATICIGSQRVGHNCRDLAQHVAPLNHLSSSPALGGRPGWGEVAPHPSAVADRRMSCH